MSKIQQSISAASSVRIDGGELATTTEGELRRPRFETTIDDSQRRRPRFETTIDDTIPGYVDTSTTSRERGVTTSYSVKREDADDKASY